MHNALYYYINFYIEFVKLMFACNTPSVPKYRMFRIVFMFQYVGCFRIFM